MDLPAFLRVLHDGINPGNDDHSATPGRPGDARHCVFRAVFLIVIGSSRRPPHLPSSQADEQRQGGAMNLSTMAIVGVIAAVILVAISVTLINKFARGD
jgi:hypothetical protein